MRKLSVLLSTSILFLSSCTKLIDDGPITTEIRSTGEFTGIDSRTSATVYYQQDNVFKVEVTAGQNTLDRLETYVSNKQLVIRFRNEFWTPAHSGVTVRIRAPRVNAFSLSGSGTITSTGFLSTPSVALQIGGSGNIRIQHINAYNLKGSVSGSGNISIDTGIADNEILKVNGSGNIDLRNVAAKKASTITSGSGTMKLSVQESLNAIISGSGSVYYKGNPVLNTHVSGSGRVVRM